MFHSFHHTPFRFLFALSLVGGVLSDSSVSQTHAMDLDQKELCKLKGRVLQPADPLPMGSGLEFPKDNPKWQVREKRAK